jgi:hypothetical protein
MFICHQEASHKETKPSYNRQLQQVYIPRSGVLIPDGWCLTVCPFLSAPCAKQ